MLLHLGLLQLAHQLGALGQRRLQPHPALLDRAARLLGGLQRLVVAALEVLHRLLGGDQLGGEGLRGVLVLRRLGRVAARPGLVGQDQRLARRGLQLLHLAQLPVQPHLQLALVAEHRGGLVGQRLVALLLGLDGLRDLDLRVGPLVDLRVGRRGQVLPQLHERVGHGSSCSGTEAGGWMAGVAVNVCDHRPR